MFRTIKAVSALVLLSSAIAWAQGGAATGDLHVTVKDAQGQAVTSATVVVRDVAKGVERVATSDGQGGYSAQLLPPGTYSVRVSAARIRDNRKHRSRQSRWADWWSSR